MAWNLWAEIEMDPKFYFLYRYWNIWSFGACFWNSKNNNNINCSRLDFFQFEDIWLTHSPTRKITWKACAISNWASSVPIFLMMFFVLALFEKYSKSPSNVASSVGQLDLRVRIEGCKTWCNHVQKFLSGGGSLTLPLHILTHMCRSGLTNS